MKMIRGEKGFTLIEMMIVLLIISILILVAIPNVTKHSKKVDEKGCSAYIAMVQSQVEAYKMDTNQYPSDLDELVSSEYFPETPKCPDGTVIAIKDGKVDYANSN